MMTTTMVMNVHVGHLVCTAVKPTMQYIYICMIIHHRRNKNREIDTIHHTYTSSKIKSSIPHLVVLSQTQEHNIGYRKSSVLELTKYLDLFDTVTIHRATTGQLVT